MNFMLYEHGYSSDISKCYLRVLVDELTSRLRHMVWYNDPKSMEDMVAFRRRTIDFGDSFSALVIRIIQEKFLTKFCKLDLTKQVILFGAYADNYNSSFRTKKEYLLVKQDMENIHEQLGLHLKKHLP